MLWRRKSLSNAGGTMALGNRNGAFVPNISDWENTFIYVSVTTICLRASWARNSVSFSHFVHDDDNNEDSKSAVTTVLNMMVQVCHVLLD